MPSAIEVNLFQGVFNFIYKFDLNFSKILNTEVKSKKSQEEGDGKGEKE